MDDFPDLTDHGNTTDWLDKLPPEQLAALNEMLAISARQLDEGRYGDTDMEKLLAEGRARRAGAIAAE